MFHLGSVQGMISSWDFSIAASRLRAQNSLFSLLPVKNVGISVMKNSSKPLAFKVSYSKILAFVFVTWRQQSEILLLCVFISRAWSNFTLRLQTDFTVKAWNHLKLRPFVTPECLLLHVSKSRLWLQTAHYLYNPDLDIYFKTTAMGQRKLSLGLGGDYGALHGTCPQCCRVHRLFLKTWSCVCVTLEQVSVDSTRGVSY